MTGQPAERVLKGVAASGGFAIGPAARFGDNIVVDRVVGTLEQEATALSAALQVARGELGTLMEGSGKLGAEILEFQDALLDDDDLIGPVFERIADGASAHDAWRRRLDAEIADYAGADDDYMAARAADLIDLRDRVLRAMTPGACTEPVALPEGAIVIANELTPSVFLTVDWSRLGGAAIGGGSPTSHVAILARARGVPLIVGLDQADTLPEGTTLALDAEAGVVIAAPAAETLTAFEARCREAKEIDMAAKDAARRPARTAKGMRVKILLNVDDPAILAGLSPDICDGIGLTRTEFLFQNGAPPGEEAQVTVYADLVRWAAGRPVTIRTLDAGGDKPIPGITIDGEVNTFLGVRGLRLSLARPDLFRTQLRALARAAADGPLKIMVPMVTVPDEFDAARDHLDAVIEALMIEGVPHARPALGMMVETPASALMAEAFNADFYSIGSNDLVQYVMAAARDNAAVAHLARADSPAVLELIRRTVEAGRARAVEVSLCGDMASSPAFAEALISLGLSVFSVAPAQVGRVKLAIAHVGARSAT